MTTLGFIGSGHIGSALAKLAVQNGHDVVLSNSRGPETLAELVTELGPKARAADSAGAAAAGHIVVVTIPLKNYRQIPVAELAGKTVIDTNNYYPERDGVFEELEAEATTTAELLQIQLAESHVVKAFNHIASSDLLSDGKPSGAPDRRALAIAGDNESAKTTVAALIEEFGFDTVDVGALSEGWRYQRDTAAYAINLDRKALEAALAKAKRYSEEP